MSNKIILVGPGGHSKNIVEIIESQNNFEIYGFSGKQKDLKKNIFGYEVVQIDENLNKLRSICDYAFITVGQIKCYNPRLEISIKLNSLNFNIPVVISNNSIISKYSKINSGTFINHGAIINPNVSIGNHCIINTNAVIEHDSNIEDFCHISTGVIINGGVKIGYGSFIGSGTIIREGISIPPKTIIKAGSTIMGWPLKNKIY